MSKFTPGPWQQNHNDPLQICDCDGESRGCAPVAFVAFQQSKAEANANARLIAAAPELYDLLRALIESRGEHFINNDALPGWDERASAALKKVEE